jgi:murein peptide amidase A
VIAPGVIGRSALGAPIEAVSFGAGPCALLVFGAIHGDEPESAELCRRFAARLAAHPPAARVVVVPVANPDGFAARTKNNARDVDLNRNFAARNWSRDHALNYCPGDAPLSEPEARALASLVDALAPRAIVAVHQPFRCVNWDGPADALAARMAAASGWPARASIGYPTPGSFGSAYGVDRALPVITLELPRPVDEADFAAGLAAVECATLPML